MTMEDGGNRIQDSEPESKTGRRRLVVQSGSDARHGVVAGIRRKRPGGLSELSLQAGGFGPALVPTGDIDADMAVIRAFYADITAEYPEKACQAQVRT